FGLILDAHSLNDLMELAKEAEDAGFHSIWATELYRTSFQQLAAAASVTSKIKLGTAVALAFVRSPLITSITCLDLDELSKGRLILGLGTGARRTNENFHGIKFGDKPATRIRECIEIIKSIIKNSHTGNEIIVDSEFYKINTKGYKRAFNPIRENIPVYLAGIGEKMIKNSAKSADGYLGHVVCSLKYIKEVVIPSINHGMEKRDKGDFKICSIITCAVSDDVEKAREAAKGTIAFYATVRTYEPPFKLHGFTDQTRKIREAYFNKDSRMMIDCVTDEMVDTFAVVGNETYCREKINEYKEFIDLPILSAPHYYLDFMEVRKYQKSLIKAFGRKK
ncbi:MAG: LLM class flavin-dependent oxidoreductase, partial [Candidatus Dadabacteria bacterium]|nr:LLM class flavin-dependent oxidoreductase [Candidatus Dadabacteria bacterium]NIQ13959.1 LLM class flavin-dependent oxidoreductase [Candidatus Dadabacteria bacterium]